MEASWVNVIGRVAEGTVLANTTVGPVDESQLLLLSRFNFC